MNEEKVTVQEAESRLEASRTPLQRKIQELKHEGKTSGEVAEILGESLTTINRLYPTL